jgi:hydrogenase maturation protease
MRCLAFDLGRVLFDFDYNIALGKIKNKIGASAEKIIEDLFYNNFALDFEKGLISGYDFYLKFRKEFIASLEYEEFVQAWCDIFTPKQEIVDLIEQLRIIYPVYLISNINQLHFDYLYKRYPSVFSLFDDFILSYKIKSVKPETEIYKELKKICGQEYEKIVYIDDRQDLISEAERLNLKCIKFTDLPQLLIDFEKLNVAIPTKTEKDALSFLDQAINNHMNPIIIGLGNTLRSDDGIGIKITEAIAGKTTLDILNAGVAIENHLGKLRGKKNDLFIFIDAGELNKDMSFAVFSPQELKNISLYFTHDSSLKLSMQYLQRERAFDILILAVNVSEHSFGEKMSESANRAENIIENFFIRNFSKKYSFKK